MGTLLNRRRYMGGGSSLPYDAEIEYLESETGVWLDTGIVPDFSTTVEIKGIFYSGGSYLAGARTGSTNASAYYVLMNRDTTYCRWILGSNTGSLLSGLYNKEITILFNEYQTHKTYIDGVEKQTFPSGNVVDTQTTLALFAANGLGTNHYTGKVRINYCKIQVDGVLVRDFIPVRKGTTGYMYDKVSGKLFGNNGTGEFTLGNDIIDIEYLEKPSNSNARIDLGTNADAVFEITAQATTTLSASMILIGRNTSDGGGTWFGVPPNVNGCWGLTSNSGGYSNVSSLNKTDITVDFTTNPIVGTIGGNTFTRAKGSGNSNWFLFSASNNGYPFIGRVYALKAYIGGKLALDLIPCRIGTTGYLRDRISGTFFGNAGTNAFVLGSDKT